MPPMRQKRRSYEEEAQAVPPALAPPALLVLVCCKRSMDIIQVLRPPLDSRGPRPLEDLLTSRVRAAAARSRAVRETRGKVGGESFEHSSAGWTGCTLGRPPGPRAAMPRSHLARSGPSSVGGATVDSGNISKGGQRGIWVRPTHFHPSA
jgi:hypothetical protein